MKDKDKFLEQVENIIQECEEQIKDLEEIVKIKKETNTEKTK